MDPLWYSTRAMPAHRRIGAYIANTAPLGLLFKLTRDIPSAKIALTGGTVRDAILGVLPHRAHVLVRDIAPPMLQKFLHANGVVTKHTVGHWHVTPRGTNETISISIPHIRSMTRGGTVARTPDSNASLHDDLAGRDFTVNAMAYSLNDGIIIDPYGGLHDLIGEKVLRSVHHPEIHLSQEPTLVSRSLRLASQYGLRIENSLWRALGRHHAGIHKTDHDNDGNSIYVIPRVRLGHDVLLALAHNPEYFLTITKDSGALASLAPELLQHGGMVHDDGQTGWQKTQQLLETLNHHETSRTYGTTKKSATLLLAGLLALLDDGALGALRNLVTRLHLHHVDDHRLLFDHLDTAWMLKNAIELAQSPIEERSIAERERLVRGQRGAELLALTDAYISAKNSSSMGRENLIALRQDRARWLNEPAPNELLRGRDLLALGISPGAHLRTYLEKIRSAQLSGHLKSRAAALDFARYLTTQA
ncbi:MAG: hypothetical protein WCT28_04275 [Patescibacteria group bacterium]|jgi:tRNA nucleotidyltransferase/poly(A) polymerase